MLLVAGLGCGHASEDEELRQRFAPGAMLGSSELVRERIAFDSGPYDYDPVRIALVGYSEPQSDLRRGERLIIVLEGDSAIYLFLDGDGRVLRSEVVGS